mmetsp:Transcript_9889/g.26064  ORF Transcript_9889/g.26064 Transcript_9889/m.26064 type:complete len:211 (+) Transcript_9889:37-669(+)
MLTLYRGPNSLRSIQKPALAFPFAPRRHGAARRRGTGRCCWQGDSTSWQCVTRSGLGQGTEPRSGFSQWHLAGLQQSRRVWRKQRRVAVVVQERALAALDQARFYQKGVWDPWLAAPRDVWYRRPVRHCTFADSGVVPRARLGALDCHQHSDRAVRIRHVHGVRDVLWWQQSLTWVPRHDEQGALEFRLPHHVRIVFRRCRRLFVRDVYR